jgi:anti-anti-sigma factor
LPDDTYETEPRPKTSAGLDPVTPAGTAALERSVGGGDMTTLDIRWTRLSRDVLCLAVGGDVDLESADALDEAINRAIGIEGVARVIVDMAGTTFLDSAGIHVLLNGHDRAHARGTTLRIANPPGIVRRVLQLTGVFEVLTADAEKPRPPAGR